MNIEMAPLEGITTYIYRNAHACYFNKMDKYYTPFLSLHKEKEFNHKEWQEILPENNAGLCVVPQVLTNSAEDFLRAAKKLEALGYEEININMGCPSGTVTTKGKGAGMLDDPMKMDRFLEEIFAQSPVAISVKTRLGMERPEEWEDLLRIFNKYPLKELIVHARVRADFYQNVPNLEAFSYGLENSKNPICYNGDIFSVADCERLAERFPALERVMLGRGVLQNPFLNGAIAGVGSERPSTAEEWRRVEAFHDELYGRYSAILSGDRNILFKMKELWSYMVKLWPEKEKHQKAIRKVKNCSEYEICVRKMFREGWNHEA